MSRLLTALAIVLAFGVAAALASSNGAEEYQYEWVYEPADNSMIQTEASSEQKLWQAPDVNSISSKQFADGTPIHSNFGKKGPVSKDSSLGEVPEVPGRTYPTNADPSTITVQGVKLTQLSPFQQAALQRGRLYEHDGTQGKTARHYADSWEAPSRAAGGNVGGPTRDPCADRCDFPGGYQEPACQDCILRGLVNGWIVRSIQDGAKGYNYAHWARNQCVQYAKSQGVTQGAATSFSDCFFQQVHESCNL